MRSPARRRPAGPPGQRSVSAPGAARRLRGSALLAGSCSSATSTGQPPVGASPATAMSPPRLTSTPPPVMAAAAALAARSEPRPFAVAPRSSRDPAARRRQRPSSRTDSQPGTRAGASGMRPAVPDRGEVAVVAQRLQRAAHRRVHQSPGPPGGGQRDRDRLGEPFAEDVHVARGAVDRGDLRVIPEPARLLIQPCQFGVGDGQHPGQVVRRPGRDPGAGAQGVPLRDSHRGRADVDHRPSGGGQAPPRVSISCPRGSGRS